MAEPRLKFLASPLSESLPLWALHGRLVATCADDHEGGRQTLFDAQGIQTDMRVCIYIYIYLYNVRL